MTDSTPTPIADELLKEFGHIVSELELVHGNSEDSIATLRGHVFALTRFNSEILLAFRNLESRLGALGG